MYSVIYIFRVPKAQVGAFLEIQRQAAKIYKEYGALDDTTWGPADLAAKYGCTSFSAALSTTSQEVIFVEVATFRDRGHHDEVMARVDSDERISTLYRQLTNLIDVSTVVRGEFEQAV